FVAGAALAFAHVLFATTLVRMDLDDLTAQSSAVVYARIAASRTEWDGAHTAIFTIYTVEPIEYLKGQLGGTFELREPGGERDGLAMRIASVPVFHAGDEAVLFVWTDKRGSHQVIGFEQGAVHVRTDASGAKVAERAIPLGSAKINANTSAAPT